MSKMKVSRQSLLKGNQRAVPRDGSGLRSAGPSRVKPDNNTEQTWKASSLKKGRGYRELLRPKEE
jgi:hypothetical protein